MNFALFCGEVGLLGFLSARFISVSPYRWIWVLLPGAGWLVSALPFHDFFPEKFRGGARAGLQGLGSLLVLLSILMVAIEIMNSSIDAVGRLAL
ncbi:MAG: hypothetical protein IPP09_05765 [Elusimicrobia bacterium]|nr:hypothetical protein [Elusimicrobiota bacterium]